MITTLTKRKSPTTLLLHILCQVLLSFGKPYLKEYLKLNFNIDHSEDFVVCAVDDKAVEDIYDNIKNKIENEE
ncbi:hypothetical protein Ccar_13865 [Clostridium carboxidivorans P7]|uniref:Uncharacterized protein n=1 Tax=Clostridium carboxidivorans P7 TaxID=536227 RepID=C6PZK3_9CLOT|nr:hypothetical protein [Clostridium carboxidivorans]AKN31887.1 hypothetical protein Ccar_13865 [Clostridium carboxidivorans P7]EET85315.1 hypothetical protein CcarbDRAFT_4220 [Clostridium carboxidivorans P7]